MPDHIAPFIDYSEPQTANRIASGCLIVLWSDDLLYTASADGKNNRFEMLSGYKIDTQKILTGEEKLPERIQDLAEQSNECILITNTVYSSLVPYSVFEAGTEIDYLEFTHSMKGSMVYVVNEVEGCEAKNLFALEKKTADHLNRTFHFPTIVHSSTVFINSLFRSFKNGLSDDKMFVNILGSKMELVHFKGRRLNYYNQFEFRSKEDYMYYILFAAEQLELNPEIFELVVSGETDEDSSLIKLSEKYIRNVSLLIRTPGIKLGPVMAQIPEHQHWLILNGKLCES